MLNLRSDFIFTAAGCYSMSLPKAVVELLELAYGPHRLFCKSGRLTSSDGLSYSTTYWALQFDQISALKPIDLPEKTNWPIDSTSHF